MRFVSCSLWCLLLVRPMGAAEREPFRFHRMLAHWAEYGDDDYLKFVAEARPELVQHGFYGAHFYSLSHTPQYKGYPGHFPVQGLDEHGKWLEERNRKLHQLGVKVVGHFNVEFLMGDPDSAEGPRGFFKFYRDHWDEKTLGKKPVADPLALLEKNADGTPRASTNYGVGGMKEYWGCLNNPHWQAVLKAWVKAGIDRGLDGFVANYFYRHDCLCEHCQAGFRSYLRERHTPAQMKDLYGIEDLDNHQFKEIVGWHNPKESTPLRREMLRFSQISCKKAFDAVFVEYGRSLKPDLILAQWDHLGNFGQISGDERCLLPAELWARGEDYLWYSTGASGCYTDLAERYLGEGTLQARYIRGFTQGKSFTLGKYESTRIRATIAELAANGGAPMGFYTRFKDPEARREIVRYYDFLRRYDALYKKARPHTEATLLFPRRRVFEADIDAVEGFRQLGKKLLDEHVLFDVLPDDAVAEKLLTPAPGGVVVEVPRDGKEPVLDRAKLSRFDAPWTVRVSMDRTSSGDDLLLHLVNYNRTEPPRTKAGKPSPGRGIADEKPIAVESVLADIVLPAGRRVAKVECFTPEDPDPVAVAAEQKDGRVRFRVPKFLVYSVARIRLTPGR